MRTIRFLVLTLLLALPPLTARGRNPVFAMSAELAPVEAPAHAAADEAVTAYESSGLLWLVNRDNTLDADYLPLPLAHRFNCTMREETASAYGKMIDAMRADGVYGLYIQSAYRSYWQQRQLFLNRINLYIESGYTEAEAAAQAAFSVAPPGASEHQTGLAIDVSTDGRLSQSFGQTEAGKWINDNCHRFGFIVRYPEHKTHITRIIYEPWHLRYVGMPHSAFMKERGLCYEEYIDYVKANGIYIFWDENREYYLVTYTDEMPDISKLRGVTDISAAGPYDGAGYIITVKKRAPDLWGQVEK